MKIKIYLLRFAVAVAAFIFGICVFRVGQYFQSDFQTQAQQTESSAPVEVEQVKIEELIYPRRNVEEAKTSVIEQTVTNTEPEEKTEYEFDAEGDYYIIGDLPNGFKDFDALSIMTKDYENISEDNNWEGIPVPPEGSLFMDKEFKFVRINVANKQIAFETERKKQISYKFVGKLIGTTIEGRLIKLNNGKRIAKADIRFEYNETCSQ